MLAGKLGLIRRSPPNKSGISKPFTTAGNRLSTYQITFVNFVFIGFVLTNLGALYGMTEQVYHYGDQLVRLRGGVEAQQRVGEGVRWLMFGVRTLMSLGALAFMWQVRHPKA